MPSGITRTVLGIAVAVGKGCGVGVAGRGAASVATGSAAGWFAAILVCSTAKAISVSSKPEIVFDEPHAEQASSTIAKAVSRMKRGDLNIGYPPQWVKVNYA